MKWLAIILFIVIARFYAIKDWSWLGKGHVYWNILADTEHRPYIAAVDPIHPATEFFFGWIADTSQDVAEALVSFRDGRWVIRDTQEIGGQEWERKITFSGAVNPLPPANIWVTMFNDLEDPYERDGYEDDSFKEVFKIGCIPLTLIIGTAIYLSLLIASLL